MQIQSTYAVTQMYTMDPNLNWCNKNVLLYSTVYSTLKIQTSASVTWKFEIQIKGAVTQMCIMCQNLSCCNMNKYYAISDLSFCYIMYSISQISASVTWMCTGSKSELMLQKCTENWWKRQLRNQNISYGSKFGWHNLHVKETIKL